MGERPRQSGIEKRFSELNIVIVGLPGSGKSSLMDSLSIKPNYLSLGEITRTELTTEGSMANAIRDKFQTTDPWPAKFVVDIVAPYLLRMRDERKGFVLDGVPRKTDEAVVLTQWAKSNELTIDFLLHLQVDPKMALERIRTRNNTGRLETIDHYMSRMKTYLVEEEEMLRVMRQASIQTLTINTDNNPPGFAKDLLLEFIASHF